MSALNQVSSQKWRKIIPLVVIGILGIVISLNFDIAELKSFFDANEKLGWLIFLGFYVILGFTVIPSEPVTLLIFAWKGPVYALIFAAFGNTLAALTEYYIGRNIGDLADFEERKARLPFNLGKLPVSSPIFLLAVRTLPWLMPKLVSVTAGVYRVPMFTFIWTSLLSNLIGAVMIVAASSGVLKLLNRG